MTANSLRVLFIEDNPGDVDLFKEILSEESSPVYDIQVAQNLADGLELIAQGQIDVILLDLALPDSFGFDTFARVRAVAGSIPIVVLTVMNNMELALTAVRNGAQDYLVKGQANREILTRIIRYAIERKRSQEDQRFLAEAGVELVASLDYLKTLSKVAKLAIPRIAEGCLIDLADADGKVTRVAAAHVNAAVGARLKEGIDLPPEDVCPEHGVGRALRTGRTEVVPQLVEAGQEPAPLGAGYPRFLRELGVHSYICVPLTARDRSFGSITLLLSSPGKRFTEADVALAEELGRRAALAVDNARLFRETRNALQSREDLLAFVSHDLVNPLSSISMNATLIQRVDDLASKGDYVQSKAASIQKSVSRMGYLIQSLIELARIDSGRLPLRMSPLPLDELLREASDLLMPIAEAKGSSLRFEPVPEGVVLTCDHERIIQVLSNLVGNAIKFAPAGGEISVRAQVDPDQVRFAVTDNGPGIPAEQLPHIFDRNWRGMNEREPGSGLGLFISKGVIESHGGTIEASSRPGIGTTVTFSLPQRATAEDVGTTG